MEYNEQNASVTYHSDKPTGPTAGSETTDALEILARLTSHIPNNVQVLQRYYGHYASRLRGMGRKAADGDDEQSLVMGDPVPEAVRETRCRSAELLRRILGFEPLACLRCGQEMRKVPFITEPKTIDRIPRAPETHSSLTHVNRTPHTCRLPVVSAASQGLPEHLDRLVSGRHTSQARKLKDMLVSVWK